MRELDQHLAARPDALASGDLRCPAVIVRLAQALAAAGHVGVSPPGCSECQRTGIELPRSGPNGRICQACAARNPEKKKPCARCGTIARIMARRDEGGICNSCYRKDPQVTEKCAGCGRLRMPVTRRPDGQPLCEACWTPPTHTCTACGRAGPAKLLGPDGALCPSCYWRLAQPRRTCGKCGRHQQITRRATADSPDLCWNCATPPEAPCSACGQVRPCNDGHPGTARLPLLPAPLRQSLLRLRPDPAHPGALAPRAPPLGEAADAFLARRNLDPDTIRSYTQTMTRLRTALGNGSAVAALTAEQVAAAFTAAWDRTAARTWNRHRSTLRSFTAWAAGRGWLTCDLAALIERRAETQDRTRALSRPVIEALWDRRDVPLREKTLWRLLYESAARAQSVLSLDIEDLDLPGKRGRITAKGGVIRWIHWQSGTARLLPRLIAGRTSGPVFLGHRRPAPVRTPAAADTCPHTGRARLSYERAEYLFKQAVGRATLHQLRHSRLTHLGEDGWSAPCSWRCPATRTCAPSASTSIPAPTPSPPASPRKTLVGAADADRCLRA